MTKDNFTEIEGRILDIDPKEITKKLEATGARKVDQLYFRRYVFDVIPVKPNRWIRLRTDGKLTTLAVKDISDNSVTGTFEWEVTVSDFDTTLTMLKQMGIEHRGYQENRRTLYELNGVEVSIDEWPKIPPYLEIEASSEKEISDIAELLGYTADDVTGLDNEKIYASRGINLKEVKELRF